MENHLLMCHNVDTQNILGISACSDKFSAEDENAAEKVDIRLNKLTNIKIERMSENPGRIEVQEKIGEWKHAAREAGFLNNSDVIQADDWLGIATIFKKIMTDYQWKLAQMKQKNFKSSPSHIYPKLGLHSGRLCFQRQHCPSNI